MQAASSPAQTGLCLPALDQWDGLCLEYKLDWPLHIVLTPEVIDPSFHASYECDILCHQLRKALLRSFCALASSCSREPPLTGDDCATCAGDGEVQQPL